VTAAILISLLSADVLAALVEYLLNQHQLIGASGLVRAGGVWGTPDVLYPISSITFLIWVYSFKGSNCKPLGGLGAILSLLVTVLCFSRGALTALGMAIVVSPGNVFRVPRIFPGLVFLALLFVVGFRAESSTGGLTALLDGSGGRLKVWSSAIEVSSKRVLTGYGPDSYVSLSSGDLSEAKSMYISQILDGGVVQISLFCAFVVAVFRRGREVGGVCGDLANALMVFLLCSGIFDTPLLFTYSRLPCTIAFSCALALALSEGDCAWGAVLGDRTPVDHVRPES
jgi:hypothetical protein